MPNTIVDSIMSLVTPEIQNALALRLGASPSALQSGLGTGVASIIAALGGKAADPNAMSQLHQIVSSAGNQNIAGNLSSVLTGASSGGAVVGPAGDLASKFLSFLFGGQLGSVGSLIAREAGISGAGGSGLLSMAAPLVLGFLGKKVSEGGLSASSLTNMIKTEAPTVKSLLPSGLGSLIPNLSLPSMPSMPEAGGGGSGKMLWIVLGLLALGLLLWLLSGRACNPQQTAENVQDSASQATSAVSGTVNSALTALGEFFKRKLPDGTELNIPKLGIENRLIDFIEDGSKPVDKTTWFDFDRLLFDTGKATLQPSSQEQLSNIAAILKAYPKVKIKIGGYTDNTGNKEANQKLSDARANNVMAEMAKLGVDASRMSAEGFGEDHPVADNATEEGRAKNRRISLRVTEK
jgi:outer membrane protein OmpA-like peptidoglycan-associated protein